MARLNSWFSEAAAEKAISGDYSGVVSELPKAMFESGDKGTILFTTFGMDGLGGYTYRNKSGSEILAANNARIVGFYRDAGYNGGNRLWIEQGGETFHIDQYRTEKSNVTKDIAIGVGTVLTAGAASVYFSGGFGAAGTFGATEASASALPAASGGGASGAVAGGGAAAGGAGGAAAGGAGGATLGQIGSALSTVSAVAKGLGSASGAVAAVVGAASAANAASSASKNTLATTQQAAANAAQLTGARGTSILESIGPYLLFGGAVITIAMLFKGGK